MRKGTQGAGWAMVAAGWLWTSAAAAVKTEVIEYKHGETVLEGYLAYDTAFKGKRPGVLVVHEWWGHNAYARKRAEQVAKLGYAAFALDMYGKGVLAKTQQEAGTWAGKLKSDRRLMRARAQAGLDVLTRHPTVETARLAAIGYCFGGTTVLELARGGANLLGVVSFHGGLDFPEPRDIGQVKAKILVLHGGDDFFVKAEDVELFQSEMRKAGVDWQFVSYGGAVHAFTNPEAGSDPSKGVAYHASADRRSWDVMKGFFSEIFPLKK